MTVEERVSLASEGYTADQIDEIQQGYDAGVDVSVYKNKDFYAIQMRQILQGLIDGVDVSRYADTKYDWFQMEEIRKGLVSGVNVDAYCSPDISYDRMRQVREGLEQGIDLSKYVKLSAGIICQVRKACVAKVNIFDYLKEGYDPDQLEEIRTFMERGIEGKEYISAEYRAPAIRQILLGIETGLNVEAYAKPCFNWRQMQEIRIGIENRVDISEYDNPLYSWEQMKEIRIGLENGMDVSEYKSFMYTAAEMKSRRLAQEANAYRVVYDSVTQLPAEHPDEYLNEYRPEFKSKKTFKNFTVTVSEDDMEAYITVTGAIMPIDKADIEQALRQEEVVRGIDSSAIDRLVHGTYTDKKIKVASGKERQDGSDGWYEYFFRTNIDKFPKMNEAGSADNSDGEWFETVKKGQKIAYYHSATEGSEGYNVKGGIITARKGREKKILTGKGFAVQIDGKTYVSLLDGMIELTENHIEITKVLVVDDAHSTNVNINFDGNVYVRGNVGNGVRIEASDDVIIDGHVEGATIECGRNVFIKKGMNAGKEGYVRAAGSITGRYFEYAKLHASGNIKADYYFGCDIYADRKVEAEGVKGSIVGGTCYAVEGIIADNIGNHAGMYTTLKLGVNDGITKQMKNIEHSIASVNEEVKILHNAYDDFVKKYPSEIRNTNPTFLKLENAIYTKEMERDKLIESKTELSKNMERMQESEIIIRNTLYEGVDMDINAIRWNSKELKSVAIKKSGRRVVVDSL
jgi:uncharacterized protein (DUF342 family)